MGLFADQLGWVVLLLAAAGAVDLTRRSPFAGSALLLAAASNSWFFFDYGAWDWPVFFLPTLLLACVLAGQGVEGLLHSNHARLPAGQARIAGWVLVAALALRPRLHAARGSEPRCRVGGDDPDSRKCPVAGGRHVGLDGTQAEVVGLQASPLHGGIPMAKLALVALAPSLLLTACGTYTIQLEDDWNYRFTTDITAEATAIEDCPKDVLIDWGDLTSDLLAHEMDPTTDIDLMRVVRFDDKSQEDVLLDISTNALTQQDISGNVDYEPTSGETSANLSDFEFNGTKIDPTTEVCSELGATFLLTALTGLYEYRMLGFFEPTPDETNTEVYLDSDSATLVFDSDLSRGGTISVPAGRDYMVNWMDLTRDGQDLEFSVSNIDFLMLARYELTVEEMQDQFFDLQLIADEMYTADVGGLGEFELVNATDEGGAAFAGFEGDGLWLLGMFCTTCANPAPLFLGVIEAG